MASDSARTAFVFAGGGSLGAVEVGMLHALVERGVRPDFAVGASAGAINAAYYAGDPSADGHGESPALVVDDLALPRVHPGSDLDADAPQRIAHADATGDTFGRAGERHQ